ncbi:hypothetical protein SLNWT_3616 [Streptomyces albus]|uniref:Uncharacterized protein n=1 Tax=Streptomyces albus (strain ATCC 21838 / DSM 41398 / FERM P-419 / JCM 4703 / NBRC 107858) TaxID=1081613 RepID=A0A0B5F0Z9_STRA4|nr:hypothetical protein SLNWT_3616 [Streptomyces albus]AOU78296.1 hypothetical protein SLNHY_3605 [Streptomyces albus]AYN34047.1 hypothetical protein DUI70_3546 [Streptomyces albus]
MSVSVGLGGGEGLGVSKIFSRVSPGGLLSGAQAWKREPGAVRTGALRALPRRPSAFGLGVPPLARRGQRSPAAPVPTPRLTSARAERTEPAHPAASTAPTCRCASRQTTRATARAPATTGAKVTFEIDKDDPQNPTGNRFTGQRFEKALNVTLNSVVFRSTGQDLTTAGTYIEMTSRLTEPVLLGLAVLAIRNRVTR